MRHPWHSSATGYYTNRGGSVATFLDRLLRTRCSMYRPLWEIVRPGTSASVVWTDHTPNPRFAIYDLKGDGDPADPSTSSDDFVLDKETGLVWARDANLLGSNNWLDSNTQCRELELGNRSG